MGPKPFCSHAGLKLKLLKLSVTDPSFLYPTIFPAMVAFVEYYMFTALLLCSPFWVPKDIPYFLVSSAMHLKASIHHHESFLSCIHSPPHTQKNTLILCLLLLLLWNIPSPESFGRGSFVSGHGKLVIWM